MMKNIFEEPYIEVLKFSVLDVLTESTEDPVADGNDEGFTQDWEQP